MPLRKEIFFLFSSNNIRIKTKTFVFYKKFRVFHGGNTIANFNIVFVIRNMCVNALALQLSNLDSRKDVSLS